MPSNQEIQLVSKIIETGDYASAIRLKITEEFFTDPLCRTIFRWLNEHYHAAATYGTVPSFQIVYQVFPQFSPVSSPDAVPTLATQIRSALLRAQVLQTIDRLAFEANKDPMAAVNTMRDAVSRLAVQHEVTEDLLLSSAHHALLTEYDLVASGRGLLGIPWPWKILDDETKGIKKGDFIVLYARPKNGKTWCGLSVATHAYTEGQRRVLVYSLEMKPINVMRRAAALIAKIDYNHLIKGTLNPLDYQRYAQILRGLEGEDSSAFNLSGRHPAFMVTGRTRGDHQAGGINTLRAKIEEFCPDLVMIDGMYLMKDDRGNVRSIDWKSQYHISQDVKGLADAMDIPIIGITQSKRGTGGKDGKEADLDDIAFADAVGQDADLVMNARRRKNPQTGEWELILSFPGVRETLLENFSIHYHPAVNLEFKSSNIAPDPVTNNSPGFGGGGGHKQVGAAPPGPPHTSVPVFDVIT